MKKEGIKHKRLLVEKLRYITVTDDDRQKFKEGQEKIKWGLSKGMRLVFIDTTFVTCNTIKKKSFNKPYEYHKLLQEDLVTKKIAVMMAVSAKYGVEGYLITKKNVNSEIFCQLLSQIEKHGTWCLCILDNWKVHTSNFTSH
jgi:hypothetical protein